MVLEPRRVWVAILLAHQALAGPLELQTVVQHRASDLQGAPRMVALAVWLQAHQGLLEPALGPQVELQGLPVTCLARRCSLKAIMLWKH